MSEKVKVASIVVVFPGGERREMTLYEAKALYVQLAELFGSKPAVISVPVYVQRDHWPRIIDTPQPVWYETQPNTGRPGFPQVWCKADSTT
jgi:hypothetical protein